MSEDNKSADELIEGIRGFIHQCTELLDEKKQPDMSGLQEQVGKLQGAVQNLTLDQVRDFQPKLEELMEEINTLEKRLKEERDLVRQKLQTTDETKQAHTAYAKAQGGQTPEIVKNDNEEGQS